MYVLCNNDNLKHDLSSLILCLDLHVNTGSMSSVEPHGHVCLGLNLLACFVGVMLVMCCVDSGPDSMECSNKLIEDHYQLRNSFSVRTLAHNKVISFLLIR